MNKNKILFIAVIFTFLCSCTSSSFKKVNSDDNKKYFSSSGFALIYDDSLYEQKIVNKRLNNENILLMHNTLKTNLSIKIINPINSKSLKTKVYKNANYPKIFNVVVSKKIASILELDSENPFVEILEIKKNKTFVAKESNTFDEEKNVANKAPVEQIQMNDIAVSTETNTLKVKKKSFFIIISDFYYADSANNLKKNLKDKVALDNIYIKKINNKQHRLIAGPFKNFNALKTTYISLNNLGFENLNIYKK